jgi:hypothetical protein
MRSKTFKTIALEAIGHESGHTVKHLRRLANAGMPLDKGQALQWLRMRTNGRDSHSAPKHGPGGNDELRAEKIRLTSAQASRAELALQEQSGLLIARTEVAEMLAKIGQALSAMIARTIVDIPGITEGLPRNKSAPLVKAKMRELQAKLADLESEFWTSHKAEE